MSRAAGNRRGCPRSAPGASSGWTRPARSRWSACSPPTSCRCTSAGNVPTLTGLVADGRSSALFAVLAGVGVALATGGPRRRRTPGAHLAAAAGLVVRGRAGRAARAVAGGASTPPVAVILAYYGLLFVVAAPLLRLPRRRCWPRAAVVSCVLAPVLEPPAARRPAARPGRRSPGWPRSAEPGRAAASRSRLTGYYPVLPWTDLPAGRDGRGPAGPAPGPRWRPVCWSAAPGWRWPRRGRRRCCSGRGGGAAALGRRGAGRAQLRHHARPTAGGGWPSTRRTPARPFDLAHTTGTALAVLGADAAAGPAGPAAGVGAGRGRRDPADPVHAARDGAGARPGAAGPGGRVPAGSCWWCTWWPRW